MNLKNIHIGTQLRTNHGELITVESISTKHQHRKVGYHREGDPYHIKYVRLAQCEIVTTPITPELLEANGWKVNYYPYPEGNHDEPYYATLGKGERRAEFKFGRNSLNIWLDYDDNYHDAIDPVLHLRCCNTAEHLAAAFALVGINYELK